MNPMIAVLIVFGVIMAAFMYMTARSASVSDILDALKSGAKVIDVRTAGEYRGGAFPRAINIPVDKLADRLDKVGDPSHKIIVYCHSGMRAGSAKHILTRNGFTDVINGGSLHNMMTFAGDRR